MKKIYIAGPDVFEENSIQIGKHYTDLCKNYGFLGLYPLDNIVNFNQKKEQIAYDIFQANVKLINEADLIIANLNPFRGKEADSGTVWECGYGYGLGKPVYGYMKNTDSYLNQFNENEKSLKNGTFKDTSNRVIEDFNYPINLMIACSTNNIIQGNFEDVLKYIS